MRASEQQKDAHSRSSEMHQEESNRKTFGYDEWDGALQCWQDEEQKSGSPSLGDSEECLGNRLFPEASSSHFSEPCSSQQARRLTSPTTRSS